MTVKQAGPKDDQKGGPRKSFGSGLFLSLGKKGGVMATPCNCRPFSDNSRISRLPIMSHIVVNAQEGVRDGYIEPFHLARWTTVLLDDLAGARSGIAVRCWEIFVDSE